MRTAILLLLVGCASSPRPVASTPSSACTSPEHRQFDFWLGSWDVTIKARSQAGWAEARGTQRIESLLGGCVIAEHFTAEGPATPWAGKSYSMWQPKLGRWRQTWVDDQGSFIALSGGVDNGVMTLAGEPFDQNGKRVQMRMVFLDVTADSLRWEWQRTTDDGATWTPNMIIDYKRRRQE